MKTLWPKSPRDGAWYLDSMCFAFSLPVGGGRGSCSSCLQQIGIPSQSEPANIQYHKGLDPMKPERLPPSVSNHVPKTFEINLPLLQTFQLMSLPGKAYNFTPLCLLYVCHCTPPPPPYSASCNMCLFVCKLVNALVLYKSHCNWHCTYSLYVCTYSLHVVYMSLYSLLYYI